MNVYNNIYNNPLLINNELKKKIIKEQKEIKKKGLRACIKWLKEKEKELYKVPIYLPNDNEVIPQYL